MYTNGSLGENKNLSRDKDAEKRALAHRQADRGRRLQKMERCRSTIDIGQKDKKDEG